MLSQSSFCVCMCVCVWNLCVRVSEWCCCYLRHLRKFVFSYSGLPFDWGLVVFESKSIFYGMTEHFCNFDDLPYSLLFFTNGEKMRLVGIGPLQSFNVGMQLYNCNGQRVTRRKSFFLPNAC